MRNCYQIPCSLYNEGARTPGQVQSCCRKRRDALPDLRELRDGALSEGENAPAVHCNELRPLEAMLSGADSTGDTADFSLSKAEGLAVPGPWGYRRRRS